MRGQRSTREQVPRVCHLVGGARVGWWKPVEKHPQDSCWALGSGSALPLSLCLPSRNSLSQSFPAPPP